MFTHISRKIRSFFKKKVTEIEPDEIFLDSSNLPEFDRNQFEGRIEKPIGKNTVFNLSVVFLIIFVTLASKTWILQVREGQAYSEQSEINRLKHGLIFAERGIIYDRNQKELVWNVPSDNLGFAKRHYISDPGFSHILGYISYPLKDSSNIFYQQEYIGIEGVENQYDWVLKGQNGLKIIESNALGNIESEGVIRPPQDGNSIILSIDADLQKELHSIIKNIAIESKFDGGAAVFMDIETGEVISMTSYPEYDSNVLSDGGPSEIIAEYVADSGTPFLNRAISGLYTPGSIVKPFVAIAALNEGVITPEKEILSTGSLVLPNPFNPSQPSIFRDWKAHGYTDMREAIAVSSDVYFYEVGGGFEDQEGIGIANIEHYARLFGLGEKTNVDLPAESEGVIPNPDWKAENFPGDPWRVGNTYHTSIGQYGFQITPIQAAFATAILANNGTLVTPTVLRTTTKQSNFGTLDIPEEYLHIAREGMRQAVTNGTAVGINYSDFEIAAKTGTAEVGRNKEYVNSWIIGFFPYEKPKYAFAILMERAPSGTLIGSVAVAQQTFNWIKENKPEYVDPEKE